ncbi:MAG TPA: DUF58 domain-containing protein [Acidimicrobiales bacterium]|nr:DUF58 domain-containing protein [Acidimicrobiales bacterium]
MAGVALLLVGLLTGTRAPSALAALALVPVFVAPFVARHRRATARPLRLHPRLVPAVVAVGDEVRLAVTVSNAGHRTTPPVGLERREQRSAARPGRPLLAPAPLSLRRVVAVRAGEHATSVEVLRPRQRGRFNLGSSPLWVHDPLGLCGAVVATAPAAIVVVYPASTPPATGAAAAPSRPSDQTSTHVAAPTASDGELVGLRPYVPGDRLHLLHWPTVHRGEGPFVKEFGSDPARIVRVVVDDRAGVHRRVAFEDMLGMTVAVVADAGRRGWPVELGTISGRACFVSADADGWARAAVFLATLRPGTSGGSRPSRPPGRSTVLTTSTAAATLPPVGSEAKVLVAP